MRSILRISIERPFPGLPLPHPIESDVIRWYPATQNGDTWLTRHRNTAKMPAHTALYEALDVIRSDTIAGV